MVINYKDIMDKYIQLNLKRKLRDERKIKMLSKLQIWYFNVEVPSNFTKEGNKLGSTNWRDIDE